MRFTSETLISQHPRPFCHTTQSTESSDNEQSKASTALRSPEHCDRANSCLLSTSDSCAVDQGLGTCTMRASEGIGRSPCPRRHTKSQINWIPPTTTTLPIIEYTACKAAKVRLCLRLHSPCCRSRCVRSKQVAKSQRRTNGFHAETIGRRLSLSSYASTTVCNARNCCRMKVCTSPGRKTGKSR